MKKLSFQKFQLKPVKSNLTNLIKGGDGFTAGAGVAPNGASYDSDWASGNGCTIDYCRMPASGGFETVFTAHCV